MPDLWNIHSSLTCGSSVAAAAGIPEGDPFDGKSEAELLASLGQMSGMLAPGLGGMLKKLLTHWDESGGAEGAEEIQAELAGAMNENEELKKRCEELAAAAAASGADDAADPAE